MNNGVAQNNNAQNNNSQNKPNTNTTAPVESIMPNQPVNPQLQQQANTRPEPVITQSVNVPVTQIVNGQPIGIIPQQKTEQTPVEAPKKKKNFVPLLLVLVIILIGIIIFLVQKNKADVSRLKFECSPVGYKEEAKLDLSSTLVQDLYSKVKTNIKEDLASVEFNDSMKLYLAFRQLGQDKIYASNCNLFSNTAMEPYTCPDLVQFAPMAFKEETMQLELKKLFGEDVNIANNNVQLGNSCIGGYQYIAERGEYVKGYCEEQPATIFRAEKKLTEVKSYGNYITLTEDVKYIGNQDATVPDYLVSGTYVYTFKLDTNYNYIYINKEYVEKY